VAERRDMNNLILVKLTMLVFPSSPNCVNVNGFSSEEPELSSAQNEVFEEKACVKIMVENSKFLIEFIKIPLKANSYKIP
jgi:hypothetical protein